MPEICCTIGRRGDQRFSIQGERVSQTHARITIKDEIWLLEDLGSTNGTYIQNEEGDYERIITRRIKEDTWIRLGDSAKGFRFMAHHILVENPDDYSYEFEKVNNIYEKLQKEKGELMRDLRKRKVYRTLPGFIVAGICFILNFITGKGIFLGGGFVVGTISTLFFTLIENKDNRADLLKNRLGKLLICPKCERPLSEYDIHHHRCSICKIS